MTLTKSLFVYPDMRAALSAIDELYARYLKTHKRGANIDLTVSSTSRPFDSSNRRIPTLPEPVEVRVRYFKGQESEVNWFVEAVK